MIAVFAILAMNGHQFVAVWAKLLPTLSLLRTHTAAALL